MKKLVILRGCSGSGKSTYAKQLGGELLFGAVKICSADDFFLGPDGKYNWQASLLGQAHNWCQNLARFAMDPARQGGKPYELVIIDNTNIRKRDYRVYEKLAEEFGYEVEVVVVGKFDKKSVLEYAKRNRHSVPESAIQRMADRFEE